MNDNTNQVVEDIKWTLFDDRNFETTFSFEKWTSENSFIVKDDDGQEYRITVMKENY